MSSAPYLTPAQLTSLPLGVSWSSIGRTASTDPAPQLNTAALAQICRTASNKVDVECGQTLRTLFVAEVERGPGHRIGVLDGGSCIGRMITNFHPIRKVLQGSVAATVQVPKTYTVIPPTYIYPENPPQGFYGTLTPEPYHGGNNALLISPAYFNWCYGRNGTEVWATYLNGWPHAALVGPSTADASALTVDDVTGMVGAAPWINDAGNTEQVLVTGSTPADPVVYSATVTYPAGVTVSYLGATYQAMIPNGPGTAYGPQTPPATGFWSTTIEPAGPGVLTLAAPTVFSHASGTTVTAVPEDALWACALFAKVQALQRGLATVSVAGSDGKAVSTAEAIVEATMGAVGSLTEFRRII